jgi:hypothetical protein
MVSMLTIDNVYRQILENEWVLGGSQRRPDRQGLPLTVVVRGLDPRI